MDFIELISVFIKLISVFFLIVVVIVIGAMAIPTPMIQYGSMDTYGYMTTFEEGIIFDSVWIRADYTSSNTDQYCVRKGTFKDDIKQNIESRARVKLSTEKYIIGWCDPVVDINVTGK